jgi:hypothetical protein
MLVRNALSPIIYLAPPAPASPVSSVGVDVANAIFKDLLQSIVSHGITPEASSSIFHRVACAGGQGAQTLYPAEGVYESGDGSEIVISAKDRQSCLTILLTGLGEDGGRGADSYLMRLLIPPLFSPYPPLSVSLLSQLPQTTWTRREALWAYFSTA